jgi:hypothetical protein
MAMLARAQGCQAEAHALNARAKAILEPILGPEHPHVVACGTR